MPLFSLAMSPFSQNMSGTSIYFRRIKSLIYFKIFISGMPSTFTKIVRVISLLSFNNVAPYVTLSS